MKAATLYRKRLIPQESVLLKDDCLFYQDSDILMTAWKTLKPKPELSFGFSCYFLREGFKISKFYNHAREFMYWYCDIISHEYCSDTNTYIFTDLLADVIFYPDGRYEIIDLDELSFAMTNHLLEPDSAADALLKLDHLLHLRYQGLLARYFDSINHKIASFQGLTLNESAQACISSPAQQS